MGGSISGERTRKDGAVSTEQILVVAQIISKQADLSAEVMLNVVFANGRHAFCVLMKQYRSQ